MTLYHYPLHAALRPALIPHLLAVPATKEQHQVENQVTTVLAWLIDRSPSLGHAIVHLFLPDRAPREGGISARTQLSMPKPGGGAVYPDLSICVEGQALQLIIEVKVATEFHTYDEFGGRTQPEVYRLLWGAPGPGDAHMRAVGTLTRRGSPSEPDPDRLVARDVSWHELRDVLAGALTAGSVEPEVRLVAESLVAAIDGRIAPKPLTADELEAFRRWHEPLTQAVAAEVARRLSSAGDTKRINGEAYYGRRVPLRSANGEPLYLRLYVSPAGTRLNLPGGPDALIAALERDPDGTLEKDASAPTQAAGFFHTRDLAGYWLHRRTWPLRHVDADDVAGQLAYAIRQTGLVPP